MSFISDLPDEIIGQIFSHFIYDKCTLNQLALVCQQFYRVAQRSLVQHVELRDLTPEDEKSPQIRSNFGLFVRSVDENPGIAPMVREIKLSWNRERSRNHACANQLLGKLTSLRALSIVATRPKTERSFTKHEALSSVHLEDDLLNMSDVVPYMFLESMRHISIVYLQNPYTSEDYAAGSSRITSLNFGPDILLPESVLQKILRWPRALEQLTCHVPGYASQRHLPYFKQMKNPFSPYNIQVALAPALSSLVELTLLSDGTFWPAYDKTRLDLREFKTLQRVRVPSILFFDQAPISYSELLAKLESHNQLYKYLPQSLVELKVRRICFNIIIYSQFQISQHAANSAFKAEENYVLCRLISYPDRL